MKRLLFLLITFLSISSFGSDWKEIQENRSGTLVVNYYNSYNFISDESGSLQGIEYDLLLEFQQFLIREGYKIDLTFKKADSFLGLYETIKNGTDGLGACSFSITEQRLQEVGFSPQYMPDIEVMINSKNLPILEDEEDFKTAFINATALSIPNTTFEKDLEWLRTIHPEIRIENADEAKTIRERIANEDNLYGYIELPIYLKMLKDGIRLKRQYLFKVERNGYGLIFSKNSGWEEPINRFFAQESFPTMLNNIIHKHLGEDVKELVWDAGDSTKHKSDKEIALLANEREIQSNKIDTQEIQIIQHEAQRNYLLAGGIIILLFLGMMIYGNQLKKAANEKLQLKNNEIEAQKADIVAQKELIEEKNQDITDSINYARRIQEAVLPSHSILENVFDDYFVLFQPRDIVSGDFYWFAQQGNHCVIVLADCTGHGVPGAFMSMMGSNFLGQIITDNVITSTSEALTILDKKVRAALNNEHISASDGMDIVMMAYDKKTLQLEFSGGMNSIFHLKGQELIKYKGDRLSIGGNETEDKPFTSVTIQLQKGDSIYTSTDGFQDQFGGPKGKKFKQKQLLELINSSANLSFNEQKKALEESLTNWMDGYQQVDDISLIGFRV
ncbi:MAG: SpoIIE family protein phosphatase [Flavobacteriales bacterium]|nr:SpoIIE family protein phosphatase [Flavobacteriales bacterium]